MIHRQERKDREEIGSPLDRDIEAEWELESETFEEATPQDGEVFDPELAAEINAELDAAASEGRDPRI